MRPASSRDRMVSIRLSEEEFRRLRKGYSLTGARSLSDLGRTAMLQAVEHNPGEQSEQTAGQVEHLDARVAKLEKEFERLCRLLEKRHS